MKQKSFATSGFELVTKRTRKREFLDEMNLVVPWTELVALIVYPVLELNEPNGEVAVLYKDLKVIVDLSQIKNLRLQRKSGKLVSILVKTSSGENLRFDGYENLDVLASALERLTPKERITNASFYHR